MRQSGIYKIESKMFPNKKYIGSASRYNDRKGRHLKDLRLNKHPNKKLQNHFNKYGEGDLLFKLIEPCFQYLLVAREQYYIDRLRPWFNICKTAGSSLGRKASEETKKKMRGRVPWNKGKKLPPFSAETRINMGLSHKGKPGYWTGKKLPESTKNKMSETQIKIGNKPPSWLNKNHSDETKCKLSKLKKEYYAQR